MTNPACGPAASACSKTVSKVRLPKAPKVRNMAIRKPKSPMRLATKAFLPATALPIPSLPFSYQKPINRYEHSPTPSQPTNSVRKESPEIRIIMAATNRLKKMKKRV